jgi:hypothetical protein
MKFILSYQIQFITGLDKNLLKFIKWPEIEFFCGFAGSGKIQFISKILPIFDLLNGA